MSRSVVRLTADEALAALQLIDPVAVLAEELLGRTIGSVDGDAGRPDGPEESEVGEILFEAADVEVTLPAASLRAFHAAALAAIAARELLVSGGVTAAVVGASRSTHHELAIIAQYVPDISHVAVYLAGPAASVGASVLDQLELRGIGFSLVSDIAAAVFGANLVIAVGDLLRDELLGLRASQLASGAVLVNATGQDLPASLTDGVDQVYVDDLGRLADRADRAIVRTYLADVGCAEPGPGRDRRRPPGIRADLGQLLAGSCGGRERAEDVVLVELLSLDTPSPLLVDQLCRAALANGLGELIEP